MLMEAATQWVKASSPDPAMRAAVLDEEGRAWRPSPIGPLQIVVETGKLSYVNLPGQSTSVRYPGIMIYLKMSASDI